MERRDEQIEELKDAKLQAKKMELTVKELQEEPSECRAISKATECAANEMEQQIEKPRKEKNVFTSHNCMKTKKERMKTTPLAL